MLLNPGAEGQEEAEPCDTGGRGRAPCTPGTWAKGTEWVGEQYLRAGTTPGTPADHTCPAHLHVDLGILTGPFSINLPKPGPEQRSPSPTGDTSGCYFIQILASPASDIARNMPHHWRKLRQRSSSPEPHTSLPPVPSSLALHHTGAHIDQSMKPAQAL